MKMRCLVCSDLFKVGLKDTDYVFKKEGEREILVKGRDIFEADGNLDALKKVKNEQLERKLEKIIEHYLNTGRI